MLRGLDGDAAAHRELLRALSAKLLGFYQRRVFGDHSVVEDLVQDTLIAIHTRRASYDRSQALMPWVFAIARHKMIDLHRRKGGRIEVSLEAAEHVAAVDDAEAAAAGYDLDRLLAELPAKQRDSIRLVKLEGLSIQEASERTGLSVALVKVSIHRGLKRLSERLGREGDHGH